MKCILGTNTVVMLIVATAFAGAYVQEFLAKSEGGNVVLEWWTGIESNVRSFVVERKSGTSSDFVTIGPPISPKGNNSYYQFIDESAFKQTDSFYVYRLKITDNDGTVAYSKEVGVSHTVSSVKRTWGSIKAMFR